MHFRELILLLVTLSFSPFYLQAESDLETLFNNKEYDAFYLKAEAKAAENDREALFLLGKAYHLGLGKKEDIELAQRYYLQASQLGDPRADNNLGLIYEKFSRLREAKDAYKQAVSRGMKNPALMNITRLCYQIMNSRGSSAFSYQSDDKDCGQYHEMRYREDKTDDNLYLVAKVKTHLFLQRPQEAERKEDAIKWLDKSIAKGSLESLTNKGIVLEVAGEKKQARALFEKAAEKGQPLAVYRMADYFERDTLESVMWYSKAAGYGSSDAIEQLSAFVHRYRYWPSSRRLNNEQWRHILADVQKYLDYSEKSKNDPITLKAYSKYDKDRASNVHYKLKAIADAAKALQDILDDREKNKPNFSADYRVKMELKLASYGYIDKNVEWKITSSNNQGKITLLQGISSEEGKVSLNLTQPDNTLIISHLNQGNFIMFSYNRLDWFLAYEVKDNTIYLTRDLKLAALINKSRGIDY